MFYGKFNEGKRSLGVARGAGGVKAYPKVTEEMRPDIERELALLDAEKYKMTQKKQRNEEDESRFISMMSSSSLPKLTGASKQSGTLHSFRKPVEKQQVDDALVDYFYTSVILFNTARNPHFCNAL